MKYAGSTSIFIYFIYNLDSIDLRAFYKYFTIFNKILIQCIYKSIFSKTLIMHYESNLGHICCLFFSLRLKLLSLIDAAVIYWFMILTTYDKFIVLDSLRLFSLSEQTVHTYVYIQYSDCMYVYRKEQFAAVHKFVHLEGAYFSPRTQFCIFIIYLF